MTKMYIDFLHANANTGTIRCTCQTQFGVVFSSQPVIRCPACKDTASVKELLANYEDELNRMEGEGGVSQLPNEPES